MYVDWAPSPEVKPLSPLINKFHFSVNCFRRIVISHEYSKLS